MNFDSNTDDTLGRDGLNTSATPSITLLNQMIGASPAPRMLEPFEIDLLRKSKGEVFEATRGHTGKAAPAVKVGAVS